MSRKEITSRILLQDGRAVTVRVLDGLVVDDLVVQGMKAEGYRIMTGKTVFPEPTRALRDYLIKTDLILE